jgi:hypothetical protein
MVLLRRLYGRIDTSQHDITIAAPANFGARIGAGGGD